MDKFLEEKNKLLIICFINLLIAYTETKITKFSLLNIDFELKETYIISNFNSLFIILFFYYLFQMLFHYTSFMRTKEYNTIIKNEEKENSITNIFPNTIKWCLKTINFFTSFKFLNWYIPLIIINLTIYFIFYRNLTIFFITVFTQIIIQLFFNKTIKKTIQPINDISIKIKENEIALEKINKYSENEDNKDKKVLNLAINTLERRISSVKKLQEDIL
uniref:hypothetical protein n=1 Tax=Aliarcobacter sp. TaxID=2321116 RepID=UPI0040474D84